MSNPLVSVFIPSYNNAHFIAECLNSVIAQTYQNIEIVVSDDNSSDNTLDVLDSYKDSIRLYKNSVNLGMVDNYNKSTVLCKADYIFFLDSDDFIDSQCIEIMMNAAITSDADVIGCQVKTVGFESAISKFPLESSDIISCLYLGNAMTYSGSLVKRTVLLSVPKKKTLAHDYLFWIDVAIANYKFLNIPEIGLFYRKHQSNETRLKHQLLDEAEAKHRLHALDSLSAFKFSDNERYLHERMVSKLGFTHVNEFGAALNWLTRLESKVNLSQDLAVSHFYQNYAMRVARKNAGSGVNVLLNYLSSKFYSQTKIVDILALLVMCVFKLNNKHEVPYFAKWLFYKFKR
ncbi:glycosyltransferase family 2 protein [Shewanella baltica]|uniref:glycosyltransferase family 2 protein n=1 Tax=Shewanella baltica TaxID=62322 RepID=UPI003D78D803